MRTKQHRSFRDTMSLEVFDFIDKIEEIYKDYSIEPEKNRFQTFDFITHFVIPNGQVHLSNRNLLLGFLNNTVKSNTEKNLKNKYCNKDIFQVEHPQKIFHSQTSTFGVEKEFSISSRSQFLEAIPIFESFEDEKFESSHDQGIFHASRPKLSHETFSESKKQSLKGRKQMDPELEVKIITWIETELEKGMVVSQKVIREKAKKLSHHEKFKASKGWLQKFFKRRPQLHMLFCDHKKKRQKKINSKNQTQTANEDKSYDILAIGKGESQTILD